VKRLEFLDGGTPAFIGFDDRFVGTRISALGRGCVKTRFARRVGSLTDELGVKTRLKLHLRG